MSKGTGHEICLWGLISEASDGHKPSHYGHLKAGKSCIEALQLTRQAMMKAKYSNPFIWATFIQWLKILPSWQSTGSEAMPSDRLTVLPGRAVPTIKNLGVTNDYF